MLTWNEIGTADDSTTGRRTTTFRLTAVVLSITVSAPQQPAKGLPEHEFAERIEAELARPAP